MIHEAVDALHSTLKTNFNADFAAIVPSGTPALALSTSGGIQDTGDFFKRLAAEVFGRSTQHGIGVYQVGGATNAKRPGAGSTSGIRDTLVTVVVDWFLRGGDPDHVALQTEIALDALMRSIDRLLEPNVDGVRAAGAERGSVTWEVTRTPLWDDARMPMERLLVRIPMVVRDTGL